MVTENGSIDPKNGSERLKVWSLFGSQLRTDVLALIAGLGRTYPRELARLVERPISAVQRVVQDLERAGVIATRRLGNQREVSLNRQFFVAPELDMLLRALIEREPRYRTRLEQATRRRPRRAGKPL